MYHSEDTPRAESRRKVIGTELVAMVTRRIRNPTMHSTPHRRKQNLAGTGSRGQEPVQEPVRGKNVAVCREVRSVCKINGCSPNTLGCWVWVLDGHDGCESEWDKSRWLAKKWWVAKKEEKLEERGESSSYGKKRTEIGFDDGKSYFIDKNRCWNSLEPSFSIFSHPLVSYSAHLDN